MTSNAQANADEDDGMANSGSHTNQHFTGAAETGTFITDEAPAATTPVHGSNNAGVNETGANRTDPADDTTGGRDH
jgi:hypothetical protein